MAEFLAVFERQPSGNPLPEEEFLGGKLVGPIEQARLQKVEATTKKEAVDILTRFYGAELSQKADIIEIAFVVEQGG